MLENGKNMLSAILSSLDFDSAYVRHEVSPDGKVWAFFDACAVEKCIVVRWETNYDLVMIDTNGTQYNKRQSTDWGYNSRRQICINKVLKALDSQWKLKCTIGTGWYIDRVQYWRDEERTNGKASTHDFYDGIMLPR